MRFLVEKAVLTNWMPYNLRDRVRLFKERFPGAQLGVVKLRQLYRKYKISYRKLNTVVYRSEHDL